MIEFKPRMWTLMGVSAMALAGAAACQPGGEAGTSAADGEKRVKAQSPPRPRRLPVQVVKVVRPVLQTPMPTWTQLLGWGYA